MSPFWRHIWAPDLEWVLSSVVEALSCLWSGLHHQCKWWYFMFQMYLIVFPGLLLTSTWVTKCLLSESKCWWMASLTRTGIELMEYTALCHGRVLQMRWREWEEWLDCVCWVDQCFYLKHQIKCKVFNMCRVCTMIIVTNRDCMTYKWISLCPTTEASVTLDEL